MLARPLDLAAAGFAITLEQKDEGWSVFVEREVSDDHAFQVGGKARSYVNALFQAYNMTDAALMEVEVLVNGDGFGRDDLWR